MSNTTSAQAETQVVAQAQDLLGRVGRAMEWAQTRLQPEQVRSFMLRTLQATRTATARILESAGRPLALGVFGASQCGKSYLVAELVRGAAKALSVRINAPQQQPEMRDYLDEINPAGGRESTSVVTRFTQRPYAHVPGCAALVRLVGKTDLLKIMVNGFLFECLSDFVPTADELQKLRFSFRSVQRVQGEPEFSADDVWDLQDYLKRHFRNQFLKMLEDINYWGLFADEVRFLPFEQQLSWLEWLWGRNPKLTELYRHLHTSLGRLGRQVVGIHTDALVPRDQSIIDVQRLSALMRPGNRKTTIRLADGQSCEIDTAVLCALTSELILEVPSGAGESLLDQVDVLDFPGARARAQVFDQARLQNDPGALTEVFLRGKVACLFDRFADDRDVTALILCQEGGPQEAKSLPAMIHKWVDLSHGAEPTTRNGKPVLLFHVMTKFDVDLVRKKGEDPNVRWESRLKTNFEEFFGRADEWVTQWDDVGAFRNCFFVRNPNVQQTVFSRDRDGNEFVRDEAQLAELKAQFLAHPLVRQHFADAETSWNRAAAAGHAGIPFLVERIRQSLKPDTKVKQLAFNLNTLYLQLRAAISPYYAGDDAVKARQMAEERAKKRVAALVKVMPTKFALPQMLDRDRLTVSEKSMAMLYDQIVNPLDDDDAKGDGKAEAVAAPTFAEDAFAIPGLSLETPAAGGAGSGAKASAAPPINKGDRFARAVLEHWQGQLALLTQDANFHVLTGLDAEWFADVVQELMKGAARLKLQEAIAADSDRRLNAPNSSKFMRLQACVTAALLNRYAADLGRAHRDLPMPAGAPKAALKATSYPGLPIFQHWGQALIDLYQDNAAAAGAADAQSLALLQPVLAPFGTAG